MASLITYSRATALVPALASLPQAQVEAYLDSASEAIEEACGRGFASATVTSETARTDQYGRAWLWRVPVDPTQTVTITDNSGAPVSFLLEDERGELIIPGFGEDGVAKASYKGGLTLIPPSVELAVANLAKRRIERMPQADAITSKKIGSVEIQYDSAAESNAVDPDILASIKKYVRKGLK